MEDNSILVVDDEKNIRLTMSQSLMQLGLNVETAMNGEEALQKLEEEDFNLVFLDLKMPGMDGIEALRRIKNRWPKIYVIIVTAFGTIESSVEAMKLGAVDFIQKPFNPTEIRELVKKVFERENLVEEDTADYKTLIELTKRSITKRSFDKALERVRKAIAIEPRQPEAYNLLGALLEIKGDRLEAQKFYRVALDIEPSYKPALANLERITSWNKYGSIDLGSDKK
jgi:DNA-binding NtrC family response regulator